MQFSPFDFCNHCKVRNKCCEQLGSSANLSAPVVTKSDLERLQKHIGSSLHSYIENKIDNTGKKVIVLKTQGSGNCVFYKNKQCMIYDARPFDCMIFPLDIFRIGYSFYWVIFDTFCEQEIDCDELLAHGESILSERRSDFLSEFALDSEKISPTLGYRVLKKISDSHMHEIRKQDAFQMIKNLY